MAKGCFRAQVQRVLMKPKGAADRGKRKTQRSAPLRMAFSAQARILDGGPRDQFPCAQTLFEHALHVRMTSFASVDDILKAVREKGRRDLRYYHLAFAIRTDFYGRHHGKSSLGAHDTFLSPDNMSRRQKGSPWIGCL